MALVVFAGLSALQKQPTALVLDLSKLYLSPSFNELDGKSPSS